MSRASGLHDVKESLRTMDSGTKRRASPEALALMMANIKNNGDKGRSSSGNWIPGGGQTLPSVGLKKNDSK